MGTKGHKRALRSKSPSYMRPTLSSAVSLGNMEHFRALASPPRSVSPAKSVSTTCTTRSTGFAAYRVHRALVEKEIPSVREVKSTPNFVGSRAFKDEQQRFVTALNDSPPTKASSAPATKVWARLGARTPTRAANNSSSTSSSSAVQPPLPARSRSVSPCGSAPQRSRTRCCHAPVRSLSVPPTEQHGGSARGGGEDDDEEASWSRLIAGNSSITSASANIRYIAARIKRDVYQAEEVVWRAQRSWQQRGNVNPKLGLLQKEMGEIIGRWHRSSSMVVAVMADLSSALNGMEKQHTTLTNVIDEKDQELNRLRKEHEKLCRRIFLCERTLQQLGEKDLDGSEVTQYMVQLPQPPSMSSVSHARQQLRPQEAMPSSVIPQEESSLTDPTEHQIPEDDLQGLYQAVRKGDKQELDVYFERLMKQHQEHVDVNEVSPAPWRATPSSSSVGVPPQTRGTSSFRRPVTASSVSSTSSEPQQGREGSGVQKSPSCASTHSSFIADSARCSSAMAMLQHSSSSISSAPQHRASSVVFPWAVLLSVVSLRGIPLPYDSIYLAIIEVASATELLRTTPQKVCGGAQRALALRTRLPQPLVLKGPRDAILIQVLHDNSSSGDGAGASSPQRRRSRNLSMESPSKGGAEEQGGAAGAAASCYLNGGHELVASLVFTAEDVRYGEQRLDMVTAGIRGGRDPPCSVVLDFQPVGEKRQSWPQLQQGVEDEEDQIVLKGDERRGSSSQAARKGRGVGVLALQDDQRESSHTLLRALQHYAQEQAPEY